MRQPIFSAYPIFLFLLVNLSTNINCMAQIDNQIIKKEYFSDELNTSRDYWFYIPKEYVEEGNDEFPLMIFLHGNGERGNDIEKVLIHGPLKEIQNGRDFPFFIIAPQMPDFPEGFKYVGSPYSWKEKSRQPMKRETTDWDIRWDEFYPPYGWDKISADLIKLINDAKDNYPIDERRIYITGLSYGGYGTWFMLINYPEIWAAGVPVCGAGNPKNVYKIGEIPVWLFHGGKDRVILPEWSLETADSLEASSGNIRVTVHEDLGHNCWERVYEGKDIYYWLLSHSKNR